MPSGAAALVGEYSILVIVICALLMLPVILCFAELGSYYKGTGGPFRYASDGIGLYAGFQAGWLYYFARVVSFSANSVLLVDSIAYFIPGANEGAAKLLLLLIICGGLMFINILGSLEAIRSLAVFTVLKFLALIFVIVVGIFMYGPAVLPVFDTPLPEGPAWGSAALLMIYAFVGFESASVPAGETKNPARSMPRGYIYGLLSVVVIYVLIQMVCLAVVPDLVNSKTPLIDAASQLVGASGAVIIMLGIIASVGGNLLQAIFTTPRLTYALALNDCLPGFFGKVHKKFLTPANSILVFGLIAFTMAAFGSFTWLAASTIFSRLIMFILSCVSVPKIRKQNSEGFRLPGGWLIPALAIIACFWLMYYVSIDSVGITLLFIAVGSLLFFRARRSLNGK